jgi:hypothetical protein
MPNVVTPIKNKIQTEYPGAIVASRGYDYIMHDIGNGRAVFTTQGGGLHYRDGGEWQEQNTDFEDSGETGYDDGNSAAQSIIHIGRNSQRKVYPRRDEPGEYFIIGRPEYWDGTRWRNLNLPGRVRSGHQLTWDSSNIAFEIQHTGHGIKYDVTLKNSTFATDVRWSISLTGLTWDNWNLVSQSTGRVVTIFRVPKMIDADLNQRQVEASYDGDYITFTPDYSGLTYPIKIDPTFTDGFGGDETTYIDTYVNGDGGNADTNFGGDGWLQFYDGGGAAKHHPLLLFDVSSLAGASVSTASLFLYELGWGGDTYTPSIHRILASNSAWTETDATWNYAVATSARWAGDSNNNGGPDAGCGQSGDDYNAVTMGTMSANGDNVDGTEYETDLSVTQVQSMIDDGDYGMVIVNSINNVNYCHSSDSGTNASRPKLVIIYTAGVTVEPAAASAVASAQDPTVVEGSQTVAPDEAQAVASTQDPTVIHGSIAVSPTAASAVASTQDPTVDISSGPVSVSPAAASAVASTQDPGIVKGSVSVTPAASDAIASTQDPTVVEGSQTVAPDEAQAVASTVDPTVVHGSISVTPSPADAVASTQNPTVVHGSITVAPATSYAVASTVDPTIPAAGVTVSPNPATAVASTQDPTVVHGSIIVAPTTSYAVASTTDPTVIHGSVSSHPRPVTR